MSLVSSPARIERQAARKVALRVDACLIKAADETQTWVTAQRLGGQARLPLQSEIACAIAAAPPKPNFDEPANQVKRGTLNPPAYDA